MLTRLCCASALSFVVGFCAPANATLLTYDPFNDTSGQPLLGQTNASTGLSWKLAATTVTSTTALNIGAGNVLPPLPLQQPGDATNSLAIGGIGNRTGSCNRLGFFPNGNPLISTGTVYYSFAMKVTATTGSNTTTGGFFAALNNTGDAATANDPTVAPAKMQMRQHAGATATQYDLEIVSNRNAATADANWTGPFTVGDTLFLVVGYSLDTHTSSLWINPDTSTFGAASAPAATETDTSDGTSVTQIGSVIMRQSPAPLISLDELRVGTTWADVTTVPEPSLLGVAWCAVAIVSMRRRSN
jgi:hypothetical protein